MKKEVHVPDTGIDVVMGTRCRGPKVFFTGGFWLPFDHLLPTETWDRRCGGHIPLDKNDDGLINPDP